MILPEHIDRYRTLPFNMEFTNVKEEPPHMHRELEIAFVLRGQVTYKLFNQYFTAKRGEIIIVETEDLHYICESSEDLVMLQMHIDLLHFEDRYPNIDYMIFASEYPEDEDPETSRQLRNKVSVLKTDLSELMYLTLLGNAEDEMVTRKLTEIVDMLVEHIQGFYFDDHTLKTIHDPKSKKNMDKLYEIYRHIYSNYDSKLSLKVLSEATGYSPFYISHLVRDVSGISVQELINYTRAEFAEKYMMDASLTLTQVSEFSGFSSLAYFTKVFEEWHGVTPAQFRKQERPKKRIYHGELNRNECLEILREFVQNPIDVRVSQRSELSEIISELDGSSLQLLLQVARRLR